MVASFSTENPFSQFDLPGLNLPLNWQPCEVDIPATGRKTKITSYISNLHPSKNPESKSNTNLEESGVDHPDEDLYFDYDYGDKDWDTERAVQPEPGTFKHWPEPKIDLEKISRLAFRQQSSAKDSYVPIHEQITDKLMTNIYESKNCGPYVQEIESIVYHEGQLLTFPNILQHRIQPFKLSTLEFQSLAWQMFHLSRGIWCGDEVVKQGASSGKAFGNLSTELKVKVIDEVDDFPSGMDEAKEIRMKLMEERSKYVSNSRDAFEILLV
ncbi:hypothetical protein N431DRAFT_459295 [Stipitochalara longipes BDJ]|nr:hypothetical protein N431DRAFT_459295 [Stipitochalara longipes BDJ]